VYMEQEPGSSGKNVIDYYRRKALPGYAFFGVKTTGNKEDRAKPVSSQAQGGNIKILRSHWNDALLSECEAFPTKGVHDDSVDALSGAMGELFTRSAQGHVDYARRYQELRNMPKCLRCGQRKPENDMHDEGLCVQCFRQGKR